ncbi:MAG: glycoside hydrolase [Anaerolineae bacterium]
MNPPLYVAFVWHMHQPVYQDPTTGEFVLPWTRLHGTKDYLHMAEVLAQYPAIHATVNFAPSLLEQLASYAAGHVNDRWLTLSLRDSWTPAEKAFMLEHFFSINHDIIRRYPRYAELLQRRYETNHAIHAFNDQDYHDLAVWFNLVWIDPNWLACHQVLHRLVHKGRNFTFEDGRAVADVGREIASRILPLYRDLQQRGQIEITVSPYHHPILPVLVDSDSAREAHPGMPVPQPAFQHPEDARRQIEDAVSFYYEHFDMPLRGMWPSEGSVSQAMLSIIPDEIRWIASDEDILARSVGARIRRNGVGHVLNPQLLYQPYALRVDSRDTPLSIVFRDHQLSDRIGFVYQGCDGREAAEDLVRRLRWIREHLWDEERPYLVPIILDGENCWEYYQHNGDAFLHNLYHLLTEADDLRTVTVSEYLDAHPPRLRIERLFAGSWIGGCFDTWIGEPAQNDAWEVLAKTRQHLVDYMHRNGVPANDKRIEQAWRALRVAEGSDWFWWYSSRNTSEQDKLFDGLFRAYLASVYRLTGTPVPAELEQTLLDWEQPATRPFATTDGSMQWQGTGTLAPCNTPSAMQRASVGFRRLTYGYTDTDLLLRIELSTPPDGQSIHVVLARNGHKWEISVPPGEPTAELYRRMNGTRQLVQPLPAVSDGRAVEITLPLSTLGGNGTPGLAVRASLMQDDRELESLPADGFHLLG